MAKFDFNSLLGSSVFSSLNSFLRHNASDEGFQKGNRYEVVIGLPSGASGESASGDTGAGKSATNVTSNLGSEVARRISFRCSSISIPDRTLTGARNTNIYGPSHEIVREQTYGSVQAVFYLGTDLGERYFFEEWQKCTFNPETYNLNYYKEYVGSVDIFALNEQDERTFGVRLEEAFPNTVGAVAFSHEKVSSVNTVSVDFKYRYFRNLSSESISSKPPTESTLSDLIKNSVARQLQIKVPQVIRRLF